MLLAFNRITKLPSRAGTWGERSLPLLPVLTWKPQGTLRLADRLVPPCVLGLSQGLLLVGHT